MQKLALAEKIVPLIAHMLLPAVLFGAALLWFYLGAPFGGGVTAGMHVFFYIFSFAGTIILLYFNLSKALFSILSIVVAYVLINLLKNVGGETYAASAAYQNLSVLLPLNLLFFYFWPNHRFLSQKTVALLLGFFAEYALAEHLSRAGISLNLSTGSAENGFNLPSFGLFLVLSVCTFVNAVRHGDIWNYNAFFAGLFCGCGLYYSASPSGLTIFFLGAVLCLLLSITQNIYLETYYDPLTGLFSRNSFIIHAKKFPVKYSLGIVSIDDYDKLAANFGKPVQNALIKLITAKLLELEKEDSIYRYSPDEFVIFYKNLDKNETFERIETVRRAVASALFEYSPRKKALKLTISGAVSEKKRQDLTAFEVLVRARKVLQKTRSFSHNVTSKA